jgi:hypothetical protein
MVTSSASRTGPLALSSRTLLTLYVPLRLSKGSRILRILGNLTEVDSLADIDSPADIKSPIDIKSPADIESPTGVECCSTSLRILVLGCILKLGLFPG